MCNLGNVFYKNICNGKNSKRSDRHLRIDKYLQDIGTWHVLNFKIEFWSHVFNEIRSRLSWR